MLPPSPEEIRDDAICKIGWNQFSDVCRGVWKELEGQKGFGAVLKVEPAIEALNAEYKRGLGMLPAELHPVYEGSVGVRLPMEVAGLQAFGAAQSAVEQNRQSLLAQQNAADDAVRHVDDPDMFDRHVETGAGSIATQGALRGDDPATIDGAIRTYRSGINRRVLEEMTEKDPMATAIRYGTVRESMTPDDQFAVEKGLFEPLARTQAASDVDRFLPPREPGQPLAPLSPEARAAAQQAIEAEPWNEARKRYALDDLAERSAMQERSRKQAEDAARDNGFATAEQFGSGFTSITQIPAAVRRDLDEEADQALRSLAQANLDPTSISAGGEAALIMNIMASENPATFAKEDLRLIRGKVTPEEYSKLARIQQGFGEESPAVAAFSLGRFSKLLSGPSTSETGFTPLVREASFVPDQKTALPSSGQPARESETLLPSEMDIGSINANLTPDSRKRPEPAPGAEGISINLLSDAKDRPAIAALKKMGSPADTVVIFSHGSPSGQIADASRGEGQPALSAQNILARLGKSYKKGTTIILSSCFAANGDVARKLSRLTGGIVYAARAFVTVPNETHKKYDLTVYSLGYGVGDKSGYAKFYNGKEIPSKLLGLTYNPVSSEWEWKFSRTATKTDVRVQFQKKSALTLLREGWGF
jgi:hypothetical protein